MFHINDTLISKDSAPYVIAEIGNNHQGDLDVCKEMFATAKQCGANAVKLQKRDNRQIFTQEAYDKPYNSENAFAETYGAHRDFLEFGSKEYSELVVHAADLGLDFFATAFDENSADFLDDHGLPAFKIASGDLTNIPLLTHTARKNKPIILSTGGGTLEDVRRAYDAIMPINDQLAILQCTAAYPCQPEDMNLRVIETYTSEFPGAVIGLSDHQSGVAMAVVGYTLGARVFEKHFTLNRAWQGTDHAFSLEPVGLRKLVRDLHRAEVALGDGVKKTLDAEMTPITKMSKKIVAACDIPEGTVLTRGHLTFKSPGDGIPPYKLDEALGRTVAAALSKDDALSFDALK